MEIERMVQSRKEVGFECDMCRRSFCTDMDYNDLFCFSRKSTYHYDDHSVTPSDFVVVHLCERCHGKTMSFFEEENVRLNRI